jgi:hypothetical protein
VLDLSMKVALEPLATRPDHVEKILVKETSAPPDPSTRWLEAPTSSSPAPAA